jgi:hypothetical protein
MTINEMSKKFKNTKGNMKQRQLDTVVSGGSADDLIAVGTYAKIVEDSKVGYVNESFSKNAVSVIMERCELDKDGKLVSTGEAVQVPLGVFDRVAAPYKKEADGAIVRDRDHDTLRAEGTVIPDWKRAANAKQFMEDNMGKVLHFASAEAVPVRAWDRANNTFSTTELRDQNVYTINWAE